MHLSITIYHVIVYVVLFFMFNSLLNNVIKCNRRRENFAARFFKTADSFNQIIKSKTANYEVGMRCIKYNLFKTKMSYLRCLLIVKVEEKVIKLAT